MRGVAGDAAAAGDVRAAAHRHARSRDLRRSRSRCTPPLLGDATLTQFATHVHVIVPGGYHTNSANPCVADIIGAFLEDPRARRPRPRLPAARGRAVAVLRRRRGGIRSHDQRDRLAKRFGKTVAVERAGFHAADGEITTLLGGNGSGKTTCLRMIAGAYRPDVGRVEIDGIDVRQRKIEALARLGVLHDDFGLYPRLKVIEQVRFAGSCTACAARACGRSDGALVALGLNELRNRRTAGLSHGERMKVALARAIVHAPRNIVLDEPTRGLDVFSVRALRELLKRLRDRGHLHPDVEPRARGGHGAVGSRRRHRARHRARATPSPQRAHRHDAAPRISNRRFVALARDPAQRRIAS